jgi:predicted nucleic acid-binding protein
MIVVDASVWVRALVDDGSAGDAARLALTHDPGWVAPAHMPVEVLRTLRRYEAAGVLTAAQAALFAAEVGEATVRYAPPESWLLAAIWARRHNPLTTPLHPRGTGGRRCAIDRAGSGPG